MSNQFVFEEKRKGCICGSRENVATFSEYVCYVDFSELVLSVILFCKIIGLSLIRFLIRSILPNVVSLMSVNACVEVVN